MKALLRQAADQGENAFVLDGPAGVRGHQARLPSLLSVVVPQRRSQVPLLKETAVTSPSSLHQCLPE